ncbi:DNA-binding transcriptional regulator, MocR family, contains an aminotransferase domain [Gemmobacter megaterium]|uniref:DNA-binding transcriptional regulator, MocR family, contains an aminotransferase domain n=1 Tax=Gemmobacter megaterium TaxID=1086013 RepID=A0A1N7KH87_9RHOB|nr:PLP-dependent aminotransferase family protein [Gemmobacter megaterium]GGE02163.1 GntR family transcriptional regulator [Gemmobacter megaterium]SIS60962.1 DNA-binding transcriptional regulator, MocR family, contains an aminotransferase domain [Gemmobacter megaterium]
MNTIWTPDLSAFDGPKYQALARALRDAVRRGEMEPGTRLPTVRDLAWRLGITPGTVARAYQLATQEGLAEAVIGRGTFIAQPARPGPKVPLHIETDSRVIDMRTPQLPEVGQSAAMAQAMRAAAGRLDGAWLGYPAQRDEMPLRQAVCDWLSDIVLGPVLPEDLALTNGGQHGINVVMQCVLRDERPVVLTEDLAYPGLRHAARLVRAEPIGVETDEEGMRPDAFEAACRRHMPQLVCLTTEAQNPTTVRMGVQRRSDLAAIARAHDVFVLEDDCYSVSGDHLPAFRALAPERTFYVGSLSKSVSPALRLGWVLCPTGMGEAGRLTVQHGQFALSRPLTAICEELLVSGAARRLREAVRAELAVRIEAMVNTLGAFDLAWQAGLPFAWLHLPIGWRASTFARAAEAEGVLLRTADEYALVHGRAPNAVRLAICGTVARGRFQNGLGALTRLLAAPPTDLPV